MTPNPKATADPLMQATEQYLQQQYCTLQYLLKTCDLTEAEFFTYVNAGCLPRHSYEWQTKNVISSFLGKQEWVSQIILYYHPRHILLLHDLITWHRFMSFEEMAKALKEDFKVRYVAQLKTLDALSDVLQEIELETFLDGEWQGYLEGTYGLCVNEPTAENIATKEMMLRHIRLLTDNGHKATLSDEERVLLKQAIQALDLVLSPFAPYERARSSRELWLNAIVAKYALS